MAGGIRFVWMVKLRDYKFLLKECLQEAVLSIRCFLSLVYALAQENSVCSDCGLVNKVLCVCGKVGLIWKLYICCKGEGKGYIDTYCQSAKQKQTENFTGFPALNCIIWRKSHDTKKPTYKSWIANCKLAGCICPMLQYRWLLYLAWFYQMTCCLWRSLLCQIKDPERIKLLTVLAFWVKSVEWWIPAD